MPTSAYWDETSCDSTGTVWAAWTTTSATTDDCWLTWATTKYATCSTSTVWTAWTTAGASPVRYREPAPRVYTAEEREKLERERAEARVREAERVEAARVLREKEKAEKEAADKRAEELLLGCLSAEQRDEYAKTKSFRVRSHTGRRYRVHRGWSGHVERLNDAGKPTDRFCIHPKERVPDCDNMLLSKLMLETDEPGFERTANRTPLPVAAGVN